MNRRTIRRWATVGTASLLVVAVIVGLAFPRSIAGDLLRIATNPSTLSAAFRLSVPIAFAAIGGIYAEKSGVINIGLEGLLIISAFAAVLATDLLGTGGQIRIGPIAVGHLWVGFLIGVLASTFLALLFAVVVIEFRADQIIAGLAVWLIALGLAPFASTVVYGTVNSANVGTLGTWTTPILSDLPYIGSIFFDTSPTVYLMLVTVPLAWFVLDRSTFGMWIRASGENPKALDTVGIDVHRVRYAAVVLSGVLSGIGGASLSLGQIGLFIGSGQTMVNGKGFIAITAYLFGNYNPVGAFAASFLFASLEAIQLRLQQLSGYAVPDALIQTIPFVTVIVVLVLVGKTRIPAAVGTHYEPGEE